MLDMWLVHGSDAVLLDELDDAQESLSNVLRQFIELSLDPPIQEFDVPRRILNIISKKRCCRGDTSTGHQPSDRPRRRHAHIFGWYLCVRDAPMTSKRPRVNVSRGGALAGKLGHDGVTLQSFGPTGTPAAHDC
jgi:hypothetical protein